MIFCAPQNSNFVIRILHLSLASKFHGPIIDCGIWYTRYSFFQNLRFSLFGSLFYFTMQCKAFSFSYRPHIWLHFSNLCRINQSINKRCINILSWRLLLFRICSYEYKCVTKPIDYVKHWFCGKMKKSIWKTR